MVNQSSHDGARVEHYVALSESHGLAVTRGSDYDGEGTRCAEFYGVQQLPSRASRSS